MVPAGFERDAAVLLVVKRNPMKLVVDVRPFSLKASVFPVALLYAVSLAVDVSRNNQRGFAVFTVDGVLADDLVVTAEVERLEHSVLVAPLLALSLSVLIGKA